MGLKVFRKIKSSLLTSTSVGALLFLSLPFAPSAMAQCRFIQSPGVVVNCGGDSFDQNLTYNPNTRRLTLTGEPPIRTNFAGDDKILVRGDDFGGFDVLRVATGRRPQLNLAGGDDRVVIDRATLTGTILGGRGDDEFLVGSTDVVNDRSDPNGVAFDGGAGNDTVRVNGFASLLSLLGGSGNDSLIVNSGTVTGSVIGGTGSDRIVIGPGVVVTRNVDGGSGADYMFVGGSVGRSVLGGAGEDRIRVTGSVGRDVDGGADADRIRSSAVISGVLLGGAGSDKVLVEGGSVRRVDGGAGDDRFSFTGGAIAGAIRGFETVTINDSKSSTAIANDTVAVIGNGETQVRLTDTRLSPVGGPSAAPLTLDLDGVDRFAARGSTFAFTESMDGINQLRVLDGSVFRVNGDIDLRRGGTAGRLDMRNSTLDFANGSTADSLRVSEVRFRDTTVLIDVNPNSANTAADTLIVDQDGVNGRIDNVFSGNNTLFVDFTEAPTGGNVAIPIASIVRGANPTQVAQALSQFNVLGRLNADPLQALALMQGAGNQVLLVNRDRSAPFSQGPTMGAASSGGMEAMRDISTELANGGTGFDTGGDRTQISPTFGVFATGQFGHTEHDGYKVSDDSTSTNSPSFDADNFSVFGTGELDASAEFGITDFGLRIAAFGGYLETDVTLDRDLGDGLESPYEGSGYNRGGMFGTSVLASKIFGEGNLGYGQFTIAGFLGSTDSVNADTGSTGDYGTQGIIMSAKTGANLAVSDNVYLDLRFGAAYTYFHGDRFEDSIGLRYGDTRTSFGTLSFEPGVSTAFLVKGVRVAPSARLLLEQRVGYVNDASYERTDFDYDDSDFTFGGELGASATFTKSLSAGAFIGGRVNDDQRSLLGKIAVKYQF